MDESHDKHVVQERIRWDADEEAGKKATPLRRGLSTDSMGIRPVMSRRSSIDAAAVLPIQYRTV